MAQQTDLKDARRVALGAGELRIVGGISRSSRTRQSRTRTAIIAVVEVGIDEVFQVLEVCLRSYPRSVCGRIDCANRAVR